MTEEDGDRRARQAEEGTEAEGEAGQAQEDHPVEHDSEEALVEKGLINWPRGRLITGQHPPNRRG